jgi:hypothetical protein
MLVESSGVTTRAVLFTGISPEKSFEVNHLRRKQMKKFMIVAVALCAAMVLAAPAMAELMIESDGYLRVRGFTSTNSSMDDRVGNSSTSSYFDQKLRVNNRIKPSENAFITTRFEAINGTMGGAYTAFDFQRAFMTIKGDWGMFRAGRMTAGTFGLSWLDAEREDWRIRWDGAFGGIKTGVIYEQNAEADKGTQFSSNDQTNYAVYGVFGGENFTTGLLLYILDGKTNSSAAPPSKFRQYLLDPYFTGTFGPVTINAELQYRGGTAAEFYDGVTPDIDRDMLAYWVEGVFNFGAGSAELGYSFNPGDDPTTPNKAEGQTQGGEWEKTFLLVGSTGSVVDDLGGVGGFYANPDGLTLIYAGGNFNLSEKNSLGAIVAWGKVDEPRGPLKEDDAGIEVDVTWKSKLTENVDFTAIAAFLSAGDYWKDASGIPDANFDDFVYSLFGNIQVNF